MPLPVELQPLQLVANSVVYEFPGGASRPMLALCEDAGGTRYEMVLKLREPGVNDGRPWRLCLARELIGAVLARALGLSVPDYAIIDVSTELIRANAGTDLGARLAGSVGRNFGLCFIENAISASVANLPGANAWADLLNFDALVWNSDRKGANPNALLDGERLILIDHGMVAPTWSFSLDGTTAASLWGRLDVRSHVAYPALTAAIPSTRSGGSGSARSSRYWMS